MTTLSLQKLVLKGGRIAVPVLDGRRCRFVLDGYFEDDAKDEYFEAIANFIALKKAALREAEMHVYRYYKDMEVFWKAYDKGYARIRSPKGVWAHVRFGSEPTVCRRAYGDKGVYISLECGCDWEIEHGLQIVFKNGLRVNKVGPYDGHLSNADAYGNKRCENIVYRAS